VAAPERPTPPPSRGFLNDLFPVNPLEVVGGLYGLGTEAAGKAAGYAATHTPIDFMLPEQFQPTPDQVNEGDRFGRDITAMLDSPAHHVTPTSAGATLAAAPIVAAGKKLLPEAETVASTVAKRAVPSAGKRAIQPAASGGEDVAKNTVSVPIAQIEHGESAMPGGKLTWPGAQELIQDYASRPTPIPPIEAFRPDAENPKWMIYDGSHRLEAAKLRGDTHIDVIDATAPPVDKAGGGTSTAPPTTSSAPEAKAATVASILKKYGLAGPGSLGGAAALTAGAQPPGASPAEATGASVASPFY
jgi:hypothetical protein